MWVTRKELIHHLARGILRNENRGNGNIRFANGRAMGGKRGGNVGRAHVSFTKGDFAQCKLWQRVCLSWCVPPLNLTCFYRTPWNKVSPPTSGQYVHGGAEQHAHSMSSWA